MTSRLSVIFGASACSALSRRRVALVGGDHLVDHLCNPRHVLGESDQRRTLGRRADEAPQVDLATADNDVAAAEIGPTLLLEPRQEFFADDAVGVETRGARSP